MSADETLELRVDLLDEDFKKLEKGKALVLAHGIIGSAPISIVIQRKKKIKEVSRALVEDTDSKKMLSLIPTHSMKKGEGIIAEASEHWHIDADKARAEIRQMLRDGTIYEPRDGWLRKTT
jgi:hypothetical protein